MTGTTADFAHDHRGPRLLRLELVRLGAVASLPVAAGAVLA